MKNIRKLTSEEVEELTSKDASELEEETLWSTELQDVLDLISALTKDDYDLLIRILTEK